MRISIKEVGFAVFFLLVIALVAAEAAERFSTPVEQDGVRMEQTR